MGTTNPDMTLEESRKAFENIRKDLVLAVYEHDLSHETIGGYRGLVYAPRRVYHEEKVEDVEALYLDLRKLNPAVKNLEHLSVHRYHRKFEEAIVGVDPEGDCRARLFTILLRLKIDPRSKTWSLFIKSLCLSEHSQPRAPNFRDSNLPLDRATIEKFFGLEHASEIRTEQFRYCVPLTDEFEQVKNKLQELFRIAYIRCEMNDHTGKAITCQHTDSFCPDTAPFEVLNSNQELVKKLFTESRKAQALKDHPRNIEQQYEKVKTVEEEVAVFCSGLAGRWKILAILIDIDVNATSQTWQMFLRICLATETSEIWDELLPFDQTTVERHLGEERSSLFSERQYFFSPARLQYGQQRNVSTHVRLPLSEKSEIGEGSYGNVFSVVVVKGHYLNNDNEPNFEGKKLAMKQMSTKKGNEWTKIDWLFKQSWNHESIMRVHASLRTQNSIYLFSNLAKCNLHEFMTKYQPSGPNNHDTRLQILRRIREIADALELLHMRLEDKDGNHFVCYHKDLKAENILVSERDGELLFQITDFGISSMESKYKDMHYEDQSDSRPSRSTRQLSTEQKGGDMGTNVAPEAALYGKVTASADIWAYGTVFAELVAWISGGAESLKAFEEARQLNGDQHSFELEEGQPLLRRSIEAWFLNLLRNTEGSGHARALLLYRNCWHLLRDKLLVCEPNDRANAEEVCAFLRNIRDEKPTAAIFKGKQRAQPVTEVAGQLSRVTTYPEYGARQESTSLERSNTLPQRKASWPTTASSIAGQSITVSSSRAPSTSTSNSGLGKSLSSGEPQHSLSSREGIASMSSGQSQTLKTTENVDRKAIDPRVAERLAKCSKMKDFTKALAAVGQSEMSHNDRVILEFAVSEGDTTFARSFLKQEVGLDAPTKHHRSTLHCAVSSRNLQVVKALIDEGADLETRDSSQQTPLIVAVSCGSKALDIVRCLIDGNANKEARDKREETPLLVALRHKSESIARVLVEKGASISIAGKFKSTPLHYAVFLPTTNIASMLIQGHPAMKELRNSDHHTPLHLCAKNGTEDAYIHAKLLLSEWCNPNTADYLERTPLYLATDRTASVARRKIVDLLIDYKADTNVRLGSAADQYPQFRGKERRR